MENHEKQVARTEKAFEEINIEKKIVQHQLINTYVKKEAHYGKKY